MSQPSPYAPPILVRRRRRWSFRGVVGVLVAVLLLGGVISYIYLSMTTAAMVRRAKADADRLDPGWTLMEVEAKRENIPESENSANIAGRVMAAMPLSWPPNPKVRSRFSRSGMQDGEDVLTRMLTVPTEERLPVDLAAAMRNEVDKLEAAVIEARKLADSPRGRFPLRYVANPMMILLPHVQNARNVARLLQADALCRAEAGDIDGALDSCRAIMNTGRSIGDEPFIISQLVRIAIGGVAMQTIERVLAQGTPSEAAMDKVQALLAKEARHPLLLIALRGERASTSDLMDKLTTGRLDIGNFNASVGSSLPGRLPFTVSFFQYNHALLLNQMNQAVEIAKRPDTEQIAAWVEWERENVQPDSTLVRMISALKHLLAPALLSVGEAHLRYRAHLGTTMAILAVERHRIAHGKRPESFDAIDGRFRAGLIGDPFIGGPLRFKAEGDRLLIYTVGKDGKDDGGKLHKKRILQPGYDFGVHWWEPSARRRPTKHELPNDVFQAPSSNKAGEEIP